MFESYRPTSTHTLEHFGLTSLSKTLKYWPQFKALQKYLNVQPEILYIGLFFGNTVVRIDNMANSRD